MKTLNQLRDEIHANAVEHGFYDADLQLPSFASAAVKEGIEHALFAQKIALIHSELSEALEADRKNSHANMDAFMENAVVDNVFNDMRPFNTAFEQFIKNTVEDELADVIMRALSLCGHLNVDVEKSVELKLCYNKQRAYKHGKNY
jgi:NTP pyrophosphatase (non-canonical NTP hydrolase)